MSIFVSAPFGNYIRTNKTISVTGSWTLQKRTGRLVQILKTLRYTKKGWVNKIGLRNPGIEVGLNKHINSQVLSIAGINQDDWSILAEKIPQNVNLEINLSCPNIEHNYIDGIENFNFLERDWFIGKISYEDENLIAISVIDGILFVKKQDIKLEKNVVLKKYIGKTLYNYSSDLNESLAEITNIFKYK